MPTIARLIGGAGTGKTAELMRLLALQLEQGVDPYQVGFVSFTKAARREAAERAAEVSGEQAASLEQNGWFRTLHSVCFQCLGEKRDAMVTGDRKSVRWIEEQLEAEVGKAPSNSLDEENDFGASTDAGLALQLWSTARNRLEPLMAAWERADRCSNRTPPYEAVADIVTRYEQAKRLDFVSDFTDLLGRFAGYKFNVNGHDRTKPAGDVPQLPVWFFDEQQDTSALLDTVCHRLIESSDWVYVVGDPFQAIYGWAGADPKLFLAWPAAKERIMPQSFRCPLAIHNLGESILREASDFWDRGIKSSDHEGSVEHERFTSYLLDQIDPSQNWLLLARTNWLANKLTRRLKELGVPWCPTRGHGGWNRPAKNKALNALYDLQRGAPIMGDEWQAILKLVPSKDDAGPLLERGTKADWDAHWQSRKQQGFYLPDLSQAGALPRLIEAIATGTWVALVAHGEEYTRARGRWGIDAVHRPSVRVGTIHSAKGAEADNVLWLTTTTSAVSKSCEDPQGFDEECRVSYVAATRARKRLIVASEPNQRHRWKVSA